MKIQRLALRNLNSLKGDHEIHFNQPPLANSGLFAIVGETGAGKTTILDAITLALYGQIDREQESSGGGSRIITWGTAGCFAELEFSTPKGLYRTRWERNRAHGKIDGNLKAASHWVSQYDPESGEWKYLAEKISETKQLVPQITGLDYGRFTRSVMLPQGAFARFLQADENDRADLLEQITGTGIYRDISMAAYERHKLAIETHRQLKERKDNLRVLSETERQLLEEDLAKQRKALAEQESQLKEIIPGLKLYQRQSEIGRQRKATQEQIVRLQKIDQQKQPARNQLAFSDRLSPLADRINTHLTDEKREQQLLVKLEQLKTEQAAITREIAQKQASFKTADQALKDFLLKQADREDKINRAMNLEALLKERATSIEKLSSELEQLSKESAGLKKQLEAGEQLVERQKSKDLSLRADFSALFPASDHSVRLSALSLLLKDQLATLTTQIGKLETTHAAHRLAIQHARTEQSMVAAQKTIAELEEQLKGAKKQQQAALEALQHRQATLQQLEQSLQLIDLKKALETGEACPVCGSLDHPALADWKPPSDALLQKEKEALETAENQLEKARNQRETTANQLSGATQRLAALREQSEREEEVWQQENTGKRPAAVSEDALLKLEVEVKQAKERKHQLAQLDQRLSQRLATEADDELEEKNKAIAQQIKAIDKQLNSLKTALAEAQKNHSATQQAMQELLKGNSVAEARRKLKLREEKCRQDLSKVTTALNELEQKLAGIKSQFELINREQTALSSALKTSKEALITELAALEVESIARAKEALLSPTRAQELRKEFAELDRELHSKKDQLSKLREEEDANAVIVAELPEEASLKIQEETLGQQIRQLLEKTGALTERIAADNQAKKDAGDLTAALATAKEERQRWAALNELIGSARGDRFSRFAQSLTLDRLVAAANEQLVSLLQGRYRIDRKASEYRGKTPMHLGLEIVDTYQADNRRDTTTLSGGESFLVSLSLALGLSELAGGKTQIASLFIDEGFGTLDESLLDTVIDTLENLQAQGKTIGLISHVKELRERIHHKIVIEKRGDGFSTLSVC